MTEKINNQRQAGRVAALIHEEVAQMIRPGLNLLDIEAQIRQRIDEASMKPAFLGYKSYPSASCLSVNEQVVHAIPKDYLLQEGDIISVDLGVSCNGWIVDCARTYSVGAVDSKISQLLTTTQRALDEAIKLCRVGSRLGDIGHIVSHTVKSGGFYVVQELTGHGVGRQLQEGPSVPNFGKKGTGLKLKEGMSLAIEPITALKPTSINVADDNWTIYSTNGTVTAHFEDTVAVLPNGPFVLTRRP